MYFRAAETTDQTKKRQKADAERKKQKYKENSELFNEVIEDIKKHPNSPIKKHIGVLKFVEK